MVDANVVLDKAKKEREQEKELLRPVAEFFHDNEGELFERYEAVDKLMEDDTISSDDERLLHQVVSNLASDRVDPVQSVVRQGEKYVGVIEYAEHDYWYEYTEVNDVHGRMNVGVCAKCVKDADNDAQVARGCGTTDELSERIRDHYSEEHNESPSDIETGATLVSGTTIAGNNAITSATDGAGSGLNADTYRGKKPDFSEPAGTIQSQFSTPNSTPRGIGFDSSNCIWFVDSPSIFELDRTGNTQSQFSAPSSNPQGLGVDSNDCIWNADLNANSLFQLNQTGAIQSRISSPSNSPQGVGVASNNNIWQSYGGDSIYELNQSGTIQSQFSSPCFNPAGIGLDSNNCIWHADFGADSIYKISQLGYIQTQFDAKGDFAYGIGLDSDDCIWHADYDTDSFYELKSSRTNPLVRSGVNYQLTEDTGTSTSQFSSPSESPHGIGVDSNDCIWHADERTSSIYEFDQSGKLQSKFLSPSLNPTGVGVDSNDCIWNSDSNSDSIYELNQTGTVQNGFASPSQSPSGVGFDSNGCIWHSDSDLGNTSSSIYQLNRNGVVQSGFSSPCRRARGVTTNSSDCLWVAEQYANSIYRFNQSGTIRAGFYSPAGGARGLGLDSNGYLWNANRSFDQAGTVFKITPSAIKFE